MEMQYKILFLFGNLITITKCGHSENNTQSDPNVFVTYAGHAEAIDPRIPNPERNIESKNDSVKKPEVNDPKHIVKGLKNSEEGVLFIPNDTPVMKNEEDTMKMNDVVMINTVGDVVNDKVKIETETPKQDILFITGKNNENIDKDVKKQKVEETRRSSKKRTSNTTLDCSQLDCNNSIMSICGGKMEHRKWRYRLFLNECFFRKVNCNFKYSVNRYIQVANENCKNIGVHISERPFSFSQIRPNVVKVQKINNTRRSFTSRRSLTMGLDGNFCSHPCPVTCPDDYDPECAVSGTGQRRVFLNHCKLDLNSCSYNVVWHKRPLAQCVGGKKADMRQNRGFISWMQRVGMVDSKGKLVLS